MPELRRDPAGGHWVVIAPERSLRPREIAERAEPEAVPFCPFCEGNEKVSGRSLYAGSRPDGGWSVRVVPNRFPALRVEGTLEGRGDGIYDQLNGVGAHEVIIETPLHTAAPAALPVSQIAAILQAYRARIRDLKRDFRLRYCLIFANRGALAGATLRHAHSQLVALPIIPQRVQHELDLALDHYQRRGRSLMGDMIRQELEGGSRIVYDSDHVVAFCPYASRFPFEVWVMPRQHASHFEDSDDRDLTELAHALKDVLGRLYVELADPAYNLVLHNSPSGESSLSHYHWHFEITPVLSRHTAGFEVGSGCYINATPPEQAADCLRKADLSTLPEAL